VRERLRQLGVTPARLVLIAAAFISVYFGFTIVGNRVHQYQLDRENAQLEQRISDGKVQLSQLQALQEWMQSDAYIEAMARKQGMVRPGDHPIIVAAPMATPATAGSRSWWERYFEP
jgi:cell division protein FtsB